jgi:hypothetical protein
MTPHDEPQRSRSVTETEAGAVVVIDQTGRHHHFDADGWRVDAHGHLSVHRDGENGEPVATFPPGYIGVYKSGARVAPPAARVPVGAGERVA